MNWRKGFVTLTSETADGLGKLELLHNGEPVITLFFESKATARDAGKQMLLALSGVIAMKR